MALRPEALRMVAPAGGVLTGNVTDRRFTGAQAFFRVRTERGTMLELVADPRATEIGLRVGLVPTDRGVHLFASGAP